MSGDFLAMMVCAVMPTAIVLISLYFGNRRKAQEVQLIERAMEHGQDVTQLLNSMKKERKSMKQRQLNILLGGQVCFSIGFIVPLALYLLEGSWSKISPGIFLFAAVILAIGIALLLTFLVGQRMLKHEMEKEERKED